MDIGNIAKNDGWRAPFAGLAGPHLAIDALYAHDIGVASIKIINKDPGDLKYIKESLEMLRKESYTIGPFTHFAKRELDRQIQSYLDKTNPLQQLYSQ